MPNKSVPMGKILKINKRTSTFIWKTRVVAKMKSMYVECVFESNFGKKH